ncbi:endonuclease/exonuclease/phosphatase family protein [Kiritimatiellaeota bacterium B1221]|nr:endonuclease/exonuclease/phosphatase family protein [Kiritimatiellaeota bacterium B1221]
MRFILYNIRYGTGGNMNRFPLSGYIGRTGKHLEEIIHFLRELNPDVIGLIEVDAGSYRSGKFNQAQKIAESLGHYHTYKSKYAENHPLLTKVPILNKQGNAFVARDSISSEKFHYVTRGVKKLVIELELENVVFLLVHLALSYRTRQEQLREIKTIVRNIEKPCIVAGDFNVFQGKKELELFKDAAGLIEPDGEDAPTFPSWKPKHDLDFVLHTPQVRVNHIHVPQVLYSDHLPVVCDFEVE